MDRCLIDLLAQFAVIEAGQGRLLRGVDDDDGIRGLAATTLSILGALGNICLAHACQVFLLVDPDDGIVGGIGEHLAPLGLQLGDAQVDFLYWAS